MEAYTAAKTRILEYQSSADTAVLGREDPGAWSLVKKVRGQLVSFGKDKPTDDQAGTYLNADWICFSDGQSVTQLVPQDIIRLRGEHNLLNVLAACAISIATGLPAEAMRSGVDGFSGVPHRLEYIRSWGEADWYNDSIATAPERAMAAINSFEEPLVLLAGGRDKNLPWQDFGNLVCQRVDHLILFGEAADKIEQALQDAAQDNGRDVTKQRPYTTTHCIGLKEAVQAAARIVEAGDVVLLSPGGTSFDEFRDFENRGEAFRQWVQELS
jgi:UDP-N-acetylmuramoylalanine--D-glutamate ligase